MSQPLPLAGQTHLVTGGSRGIGRVAAIALAKQGAHVILVGRNQARLEAAAADARAAGGGAPVAVLVADLSEMAEVKRLGVLVRERYSRLDVLINNAGAIFERRETTKEGLERTFALNHLAYFLLTAELLPLLKGGHPARIVNVASRAHVGAKLDLADLQTTRRYSGWLVYQNSKLMNILFTRELARRLADTAITANSLHPGFVASSFGHDRLGFLNLLLWLVRPMALSEEEGAKTTIHLAASSELAGVTGQYWAECRRDRESPAAQDDAAATRLWAESERIVAELGHPATW